MDLNDAGKVDVGLPYYVELEHEYRVKCPGHEVYGVCQFKTKGSAEKYRDLLNDAYMSGYRAALRQDLNEGRSKP